MVQRYLRHGDFLGFRCHELAKDGIQAPLANEVHRPGVVTSSEGSRKRSHTQSRDLANIHAGDRVREMRRDPIFRPLRNLHILIGYDVA